MHNYDIIIIGGGYLGLSAAISFSKNNFKVALIHNKTLNAAYNSPSRLFAIAKGSLNTFKNLGIDTDFASHGQQIYGIRVAEGNSKLYLDFNPKDINEDSFGIMVEEHIVHNLLYQKLYNVTKNSNLDIYENTTIKDIESNPLKALVKTNHGYLFSKLVVVTDGRKSLIRDLLGIETINKKYNQIALVADIIHEYDHEGIAVEKFLPTGPFAILPKKGGYNSSIVWTLGADYVATIKHLPHNLLTELIQERFGQYLGKIKLQNQVAMFPLALTYAKKYYEGRFALLGDALHAIHPLAGQGLNLCIRDLRVLYNNVLEARSLGLDFASNVFLEKYYKERKGDNFIMIESTDCLNSLFSNDILPLKYVRKLGLGIVNHTPLLKRMFMKYAAGL